MTRLVLIIPTLQAGGAERVVSVLANQWASQGVDVHIVLLSKSNDFYSVDIRVKIHRLASKATLFEKILLPLKLRQIIVKIQPTAITSFITKYNVLVLISLFWTRFSVFVSERDNPAYRQSWFSYFGKRLMYPFAAGIIAQTIEAKKMILLQQSNRNVVVINNPIRTISAEIVNRENTICSVGRLIDKKGHKDLLQMFSELNAPNWNLQIIGFGPLLEELIEQAKTLGIDSRVHFLGEQKNVDYYLNRASIFAFTSKREGFPNALAEAMVSGIACISFDCPTGPNEIIQNNVNGYLVPINNYHEFISCLQKLIDQDELRKIFGDESKKLKEKLSAEVISQKWMDYVVEGKC